MDYRPFKTSRNLILANELKAGLRFYAIPSDRFARPTSIFLMRSNELGLRISSFIYDVAPRSEVGSLLIEKVSNFDAKEIRFDFPYEF